MEKRCQRGSTAELIGIVEKETNVRFPRKWTLLDVDGQFVDATRSFVGQPNRMFLAIECQLKCVVLFNIASIIVVAVPSATVHVDPMIASPAVERRIFLRIGFFRCARRNDSDQQ